VYKNGHLQGCIPFQEIDVTFLRVVIFLPFLGGLSTIAVTRLADGGGGGLENKKNKTFKF
jgi:hypothetical protein